MRLKHVPVRGALCSLSASSPEAIPVEKHEQIRLLKGDQNAAGPWTAA